MYNFFKNGSDYPMAESDYLLVDEIPPSQYENIPDRIELPNKY
jgi:hypothetical protein